MDEVRVRGNVFVDWLVGDGGGLTVYCDERIVSSSWNSNGGSSIWIVVS